MSFRDYVENKVLKFKCTWKLSVEFYKLTLWSWSLRVDIVEIQIVTWSSWVDISWLKISISWFLQIDCGGSQIVSWFSRVHLIWSRFKFKMLVENCQLTWVSRELPVEIKVITFHTICHVPFNANRYYTVAMDTVTKWIQATSWFCVIKHLKNTKLYSIEFLRTEMTSDPLADPSNWNRE